MALRSGLFALDQLHRDVWLLNIMTGLMAVSFFGIGNLVKVLYVLRLGYGLQYVGIFSATGALTFMAMSLPSSAIGARFGVRLAMRIGGTVTVLGMALLPFTEMTSGWLRTALPICSQAVMVAGWSLCSVNMPPALMGLTTTATRSNAYALNSVGRGVGTFAGSLVGGFLPGLFALLFGDVLSDPAPYRWSLWAAAFFGLAALIPLLKLGRVESKSAVASSAESGPFPIGWVLFLLVYSFLSRSAFATCQAFCNAYMDAGLGLAPSAIGLIAGAGQFVAMLAPLLLPGLVRRRGNTWALTASSFGMAFSLLPLVLSTHWLAVGMGRLGLVALNALWQPAFQIVQMETVASRWRSLAYGISSMMMGFTFATVGLGGGYLITAAGYRSLFLFGFVTATAGGVLMRSRTIGQWASRAVEQ